MNLACVVHRFGAEIAGGSEAHCRHVAERLAAHHDVTVLTTCAKDHITWRNEYPAGETRLDRITIKRFPVARQRSLHRFKEISEIAFSGRATEDEQEQWFRENGPDSPELIEFLRAHGREFDRVLFWAFRYAEVYFGLPLVADRAILVPTAEDDPLIRMDILDRFFSLPVGFIFLTPEEQALVVRRVAGPLPPSCVVGSGFEPAGPRTLVKLDALGVTKPFVLYLGRIDPNKGCETLLNHFVRFASEHGRLRAEGATASLAEAHNGSGAKAGPERQVQLVMAGPANMPIPPHPDIRQLGFVDDAVRDALLENAALLIVPSRYESLSLVLLEGWNHGRPALVNGHCSVLKGQALRANGALYYHNYDEFARALEYLIAHPGVGHDLGRQGLDYINREYRWPHVVTKIEDLLSRVDQRRAAV